MQHRRGRVACAGLCQQPARRKGGKGECPNWAVWFMLGGYLYSWYLISQPARLLACYSTYCCFCPSYQGSSQCCVNCSAVTSHVPSVDSCQWPYMPSDTCTRTRINNPHSNIPDPPSSHLHCLTPCPSRRPAAWREALSDSVSDPSCTMPPPRAQPNLPRVPCRHSGTPLIRNIHSQCDGCDVGSAVWTLASPPRAGITFGAGPKCLTCLSLSLSPPALSHHVPSSTAAGQWNTAYCTRKRVRKHASNKRTSPCTTRINSLISYHLECPIGRYRTDTYPISSNLPVIPLISTTRAEPQIDDISAREGTKIRREGTEIVNMHRRLGFPRCSDFRCSLFALRCALVSTYFRTALEFVWAAGPSCLVWDSTSSQQSPLSMAFPRRR